MKLIENQQRNFETLSKLIKENPDLEIVPMVDSDIVMSDDFGYWSGSWGEAEVDEVYYLDERIYFRSDDEEELIEDRGDQIFDDEYPNHGRLTDEESELIERRAETYVRNLPWKKVIVVKIKTP